MEKPDKYIKNMAYDGITRLMQEKLASSSVIVMGAGSLGSGVIMNLAAMGVGKIKIIDSDVVEENNFNSQLIHKYKNLNRAKVISAKDWIHEFNPDIKVELDKIRLNEFNYLSVIQGYDIIVDCFDTIETKYLLNEIALRHNKILIYGEIKGWMGSLTTIVPNKSGCLSCIKPKPLIYNKQQDKISFASLSPIASTISALQANEVLKIITRSAEPLINRFLTFDGLKSEFKILNYTKNIGCSVCSKINQNI